MAKKLKEVIVDRATWLTGELLNIAQGMESSLRDKKSGFMCCLGFVATQEGCPISAITGRFYPTEVMGIKNRERLAAFTSENYEDALRLARDNDAMITRREREKLVRDGLAKFGYKVKFAGKYPDYEEVAKARKTKKK
jgi:hypothetical protein